VKEGLRRTAVGVCDLRGWFPLKKNHQREGTVILESGSVEEPSKTGQEEARDFVREELEKQLRKQWVPDAGKRKTSSQDRGGGPAKLQVADRTSLSEQKTDITASCRNLRSPTSVMAGEYFPVHIYHLTMKRGNVKVFAAKKNV